MTPGQPALLRVPCHLAAVEVTVTADGAGADVSIATRDVPVEWREQTDQGWRGLLGRLEEVLQA
jgi:hypothetical protein